MTTDWHELEERLRRHDHYYEQSDDWHTCKAGRADEREISTMLRAAFEHDPARVLALIKQYQRQYGTQLMNAVREQLGELQAQAEQDAYDNAVAEGRDILAEQDAHPRQEDMGVLR